MRRALQPEDPHATFTPPLRLHGFKKNDLYQEWVCSIVLFILVTSCFHGWVFTLLTDWNGRPLPSHPTGFTLQMLRMEQHLTVLDLMLIDFPSFH